MVTKFYSVKVDAVTAAAGHASPWFFRGNASRLFACRLIDLVMPGSILSTPERIANRVQLLPHVSIAWLGRHTEEEDCVV